MMIVYIKMTDLEFFTNGIILGWGKIFKNQLEKFLSVKFKLQSSQNNWSEFAFEQIITQNLTICSKQMSKTSPILNFWPDTFSFSELKSLVDTVRFLSVANLHSIHITYFIKRRLPPPKKNKKEEKLFLRKNPK